jgi:hypothetical protein
MISGQPYNPITLLIKSVKIISSGFAQQAVLPISQRASFCGFGTMNRRYMKKYAK